jgi:hypothetical protein
MAAVNVRYVRADVTRLTSYGISGGFMLAVDNGCFHGLSDEGRDAYVRELSALVPPSGRLALHGFAEGKRRGPRGFNRLEVERRFTSEWELVASGDSLASNITGDPIYFYDLRRR